MTLIAANLSVSHVTDFYLLPFFSLCTVGYKILPGSSFTGQLHLVWIGVSGAVCVARSLGVCIDPRLVWCLPDQVNPSAIATLSKAR
jgi:hypothetical protein